jgi:hypothetical protein
MPFNFYHENPECEKIGPPCLRKAGHERITRFLPDDWRHEVKV